MKIIITGGCGFIGINVALHYLQKGYRVIILDDLSRKGTNLNYNLIRNNKNVVFEKVDIRNFKRVNEIFKKNRDVNIIYHLAAQVAVTISVIEPREDCEINILGTLNILEAMRLNKIKGFLIFSSTNKVYGGMEGVDLILRNNRYQYKDYKDGIDEEFLLDFHSPYGCSKGAADQYVRDYHRIYGLNTVVFRQSCIYGENQFGVEDQGWVAYFAISAILDKPITIYGDGKQVRDILHIKDLIKAYDLACEKRQKVNGEIFNIGGGKENQVSILEVVNILEQKLNKKIKIKYSNWRPGDQKIFVSNNKKFLEFTNWRPEICVNDGLNKLISWINSNKKIIEKIF